jgi:hypothetical protein
MSIFWFLVNNWSILINAIVGLLLALVALFLIIPGTHPEDWFQKAADFLKKFSFK